MLASPLNRAAAAVCLLAGLAFPQALPKGITKTATVEGITEYQLGNGLKVLLFPDQSKETVTVNMTYLVGSRHEGQGETGMAHLLEHLVFKGTKNRKDVAAELKEHGANYNGTTAFDRTNYFETMKASDENLRWALEMEADRMVNSLIAKSDLDSEMTVVRNEFEMGENSPQGVLLGRTLHTAFLWHGYGRLPIGARSDIERVPIERLQDFYRRYYQPDNAVLVVSGKFDQAKALQWIAQYFGAIPRPTRKLIPTYTEEPTQDGERLVTLNRVGETQALVSLYHIPAGTHPDYPAVEVLAAVLGEVPSGRLYRALVDNKKATSASGDAWQMRDPGVAMFMVSLRKEQSLDDARQTLISTLDAISQEPPTKEEVERAKNRLLKQIELNMANSEQIAISLSEWASMADWRMMFIHRDRLKKVTPEDVARVAKAYFKPSNRTLGQFIPTEKPDRAEIPPAPDISKELAAYKGGEAIQEGEVFDTSYANIDARTQRSQLPGGMKLSLLPKKTRGAVVVVQMATHFGDEKTLFGKSAIGGLTGAMLMRGTKTRTRQQIQDELDKLRARMNVNGSADGALVSIQTTRENLPAVLKLAAEVLKEPGFPAEEFDKLKTQQIAQAEAAKPEPQSKAIAAMSKFFSPYPRGDVRYASSPEEAIEDLKKVTLEDVQKFHKDFYGANNGEFAAVGDFDAAEIRVLVQELFGNWKSPAPYKIISREYKPLEPVAQSFETPDKANAFFVAGMPVAMSDEHPDYPAMLLANYMLGGSPLSSRLGDRIRKKDGLSYGVQSVFQAPAKQDMAQFIALAISNPQNVPKVEAAFKEEMEKLMKEGFLPDEVEKAKAALLQERQVARSQDGQVAGSLNNLDRYGRTMAFSAKIEEGLKSLTADQVNAAFRKHIQLNRLAYFKAGDFAKAAAAPAAPKP